MCAQIESNRSKVFVYIIFYKKRIYLYTGLKTLRFKCETIQSNKTLQMQVLKSVYVQAVRLLESQIESNKSKVFVYIIFYKKRIYLYTGLKTLRFKCETIQSNKMLQMQGLKSVCVKAVHLLGSQIESDQIVQSDAHKPN